MVRSRSAERRRSRSRERKRSRDRRSRSRDRKRSRSRDRRKRSRSRDRKHRSRSRSRSRRRNRRSRSSSPSRQPNGIPVQLMSKDGSDKPITIYCTDKTTIAEFRACAAALCKDRPGFAGEMDITLTCDNRKLFSAMTIQEAGLQRGSQIVWTCRDRSSAQPADTGLKESARAKNLRLEAEFGDGRIVDVCDDGGFWKGKATQNVTEEEFQNKPEDLPSVLPPEDDDGGRRKGGRGRSGTHSNNRGGKVERILF